MVSQEVDPLGSYQRFLSEDALPRVFPSQESDHLRCSQGCSNKNVDFEPPEGIKFAPKVEQTFDEILIRQSALSDGIGLLYQGYEWESQSKIICSEYLDSDYASGLSSSTVLLNECEESNVLDETNERSSEPNDEEANSKGEEQATSSASNRGYVESCLEGPPDSSCSFSSETRGRKRKHSSSCEEPDKAKKLQSNRQAARKYRENKKKEFDEISKMLAEQEEKNDHLKKEYEKIFREIRTICDLVPRRDKRH